MNIRERILAALLGKCIKLNYVRVGSARNITKHAEVDMKMDLTIQRIILIVRDVLLYQSCRVFLIFFKRVGGANPFKKVQIS